MRIIVLSALYLASMLLPAPALATGTPCVATRLAARRLPTGPAQYQAGSLRLANGASLRLQGTPAELSRVRDMRLGDPVAACYGPLEHYADAGPARTITVLDLANGAYFGALIGSWKGR